MTDLQSEMRAEYRKRRRWTNDFPTDETVDSEMSRTELGAIIEVLCRLRRLDAFIEEQENEYNDLYKEQSK